MGIYTKKGKPHFMAMRSLAESLRLFDHGLAVYDDDSGDHRFVRFNSDGLDVIKAWRQECLDEGITQFEYPRSDSSSCTLLREILTVTWGRMNTATHLA